MIGFVIGAACGLLQLFLLSKVVWAVQAGNSGVMLLLLLLKMLVLAGAFVPVVLFLRGELLWCAIGITVALVGGSIAVFCKRAFSKGEHKS